MLASKKPSRLRTVWSGHPARAPNPAVPTGPAGQQPAHVVPAPAALAGVPPPAVECLHLLQPTRWFHDDRVLRCGPFPMNSRRISVSRAFDESRNWVVQAALTLVLNPSSSWIPSAAFMRMARSWRGRRGPTRWGAVPCPGLRAGRGLRRGGPRHAGSSAGFGRVEVIDGGAADGVALEVRLDPGGDLGGVAGAATWASRGEPAGYAALLSAERPGCTGRARRRTRRTRRGRHRSRSSGSGAWRRASRTRRGSAPGRSRRSRPSP